MPQYNVYIKKLLFFLLLVKCGVVAAQTFTNPLLPAGADPWSVYKNGFYYYTHTVGNKLVLYKTKNLADLKTAEAKTIFLPPTGTPYSKGLWAPEIHYIDSAWYFYFAADDGHNKNHRLYVLENKAADPMEGEWTFKGKVTEPSDKWAIDASVFKHKDTLYMVWSGWEGDENGQQDIYIARMKNPWTMEGKRVRLSSPLYDWERHGALHDSLNPPNVYVNEGPQILTHHDQLFLIYSASGCWTDYYALGMLSIKENKNLLDSAAWTRHPQPVFSQWPAHGVYAPGHNSFFKSPDGTEDWILYHANSEPGQGCGRFRSPRAQKFTWKSDGTPDFGVPVPAGMPLTIPSEDKKKFSKHSTHIPIKFY
jgi:GH43 family beta-xylosidase